MTIPVIFPALIIDAGIPMIALAWPLMLILLLPVILIEAFLCKKWLSITTRQAMKSNALSNLVSTIIGIPLAWAVMLGVEFGVAGIAEKSSVLQHALDHWNSPLSDIVGLLLRSAWIGPVEGRDIWVIPASTLVLLIPFFFTSYGIEYAVLHHMVGMPEGGPPNVAYPRVRLAVRNANLVTYGAMFIAASVWLIVCLPRH